LSAREISPKMLGRNAAFNNPRLMRIAVEARKAAAIT
jgi:hypothetical protein